MSLKDIQYSQFSATVVIWIATVDLVKWVKVEQEGECRVPMIKRPVVTEPFESVAVDIVGHLPI